MKADGVVRAFAVFAAAAGLLHCSSPEPSSSDDDGGGDAELYEDSDLDSDVSVPYEDATCAPMEGATVDQSSFVRVANWVAGSPPEGYDVCIAERGAGGFQGPVVGQAWAAIDAGGAPPALSFPWVTSYLAVAPGDYIFRLVPFGSGCTMGVSADFTEVQPLSPLAYTTLFVFGSVASDGGAPQVRIEEFEDDQNVAGYAAVRFVHASPGLAAVDFGLLTPAPSPSMPPIDGGGTFSSVVTDVAYGSISRTPGADAGMIDDNGYLLTPPWTGVVLAARTTEGADLVASGGDSVGYADAVTLALVGDSSGNRQLVQCDDNYGAGPFLSDCTLLGFASPDAGPTSDGGIRGEDAGPDAIADGDGAGGGDTAAVDAGEGG